MKVVQILVASLSILAAQSVRASWFEFCDMEGEVESISTPTQGEYELTVNIEKSVRAKDHGDESYTNCKEHIGEHLPVHFVARELPRVPAVGDKISFFRSAVDGFSQNGAYAGTSINTKLHALRAESTGTGR